MHERLRTRFIADLQRDIELLSGARFERFGNQILDHLCPEEWQHRGTTVAGAPVGYVVDSVAGGGRFVGEYSSRSDYFQSGLEKLRADVLHATTNHPQVQKLWVFSSREKPPSATTEVEQLIADQAQSVQLIVLDNRGIAEHVVDHLLDDTFIQRIVDSLPFLRRVADEWAMTHRVPEYPTYVSRPEDEAELVMSLRRERLVRVVGMSGLGKSALCSSVARQCRSQYELVVWHDSADVKTCNDLAAVDSFRSGTKVNLLSLLKTRACLLVLDDLAPEFDTSSLLKHLSDETHVLVTSQFGQPGSFPLPPVSVTQARAILQGSNALPCPDEVFEICWSAIGGHPLLLSILGTDVTLDADGWDAVKEACLDPVELEDDAAQRVCQRILKRHIESIRREVEFLAWADTSRVDVDVWKKVCGVNSRRTLERRNFLAAAAQDVLRVHDLVFQSAKALATHDSRLWREFSALLAEYIAKEMRGDALALQRISRLHCALFARELVANSSPFEFRYAYALARPPGATVELLGDPVEQAQSLQGSAFGSDTHTRIFSIVECIEALYTANKELHGIHVAKTQIRSHLQAFELLKGIQGLPDRELRDLRHHHAKALLWAGERAPARQIFEELVNSEPDFFAARLQLARILALQRNEAGRSLGPDVLAHVEAIVEAAEVDEDSVSDAVVLATFALLREQVIEHEMIRVARQHQQLLIERLRRTIPFTHQLPFTVAAALGPALWYRAPDLFRKVVDALPLAFATPENDRERFELAQTMKFAAKALASDDPARARHFLIEGRQNYERIDSRNPYQTVQFSECLLLLQAFVDASTELLKVPEANRDAFWNQRMAQTLLGQGKPGEALRHIDCALSEPQRERYHAAFLHDRWKTRIALGDDCAIEDLRRALGVCEAGKYRTELEAKLSAATQSA